MKKHLVLPLTVYEFSCPPHMLDEARREVAGLEWASNDLNYKSATRLNRDGRFVALHHWFDECIEQVRRDLGLPFEALTITQSWANKAEKGQGHHGHTHPNSYMSGVFYLTSGDSGVTQFYRLDPWFDFFLINIDTDTQHALSFTTAPVAGTLLLFPSSVAHCVSEHTGDAARLSISFNVFPEGRFDDRKGSLRFLHLRVVPDDPDAKP